MKRCLLKILLLCTLVFGGIVAGGTVMYSTLAPTVPKTTYSTLAEIQLQHNLAANNTLLQYQEKALAQLPTALHLWLSITLIWGIVVGIIRLYLTRKQIWLRPTDPHITLGIWIFNAALVVFLGFSSWLPVVVFNSFPLLAIFFSSILCHSTTGIVRWWSLGTIAKHKTSMTVLS